MGMKKISERGEDIRCGESSLHCSCLYEFLLGAFRLHGLCGAEDGLPNNGGEGTSNQRAGPEHPAYSIHDAACARGGYILIPTTYITVPFFPLRIACNARHRRVTQITVRRTVDAHKVRRKARYTPCLFAHQWSSHLLFVTAVAKERAGLMEQPSMGTMIKWAATR